MTTLPNYRNGDSGFTLVELMVTLVVALILSSAVYAAYKVQLKTSTAQDQVIEVQQNIRAAMYRLNRELRMAGYDPQDSRQPGIKIATAGRIRFTQDITGDPVTGASDGDDLDAGETVDIRLTNDGNDDGAVDGGGVGTIWMDLDNDNVFDPDEAIAENIERIQFFYTLQDGTTGTNFPTQADRDDIHTVTVSILARSEDMDPGYTNTIDYTLGDGITLLPATLDNFRRRLMINEIFCRNNNAW